MKYVSTRGQAPALSFADMLLRGMAPDGGLYVPEHWPRLSMPSSPGLNQRTTQESTETSKPSSQTSPYLEAAHAVLLPFAGEGIAPNELRSLIYQAYESFAHPEVAPLSDLRALREDLWLMELYHGPTLAFKDVALQLLGRLIEHELATRGDYVTIVGATSGDTGSAAIEACRDRRGLEVFILHPHGRVSEVQRRQMTTVTSENIHNIAIEGSFDDCQDIVKAMFADEPFRRLHRLAAVNSINFARVAAQIVYYYTAASTLANLTGRNASAPVSFAVPSGNFGNAYASYAAMRTGLNIRQLVVGSNRNDILTRFFQTGRLETRQVIPTTSPSMDIQVSSNLERLLFEVRRRDGYATASFMEELRNTGHVTLNKKLMNDLCLLWSAARVSEEETTATMADAYQKTGRLIDPHTAVGLGAALKTGSDQDVPLIVLATAHPAKFPDVVQAATGLRPELPPRVADLHERAEHLTVLPNDLNTIQRFIAHTITSTIS